MQQTGKACLSTFGRAHEADPSFPCSSVSTAVFKPWRRRVEPTFRSTMSSDIFCFPFTVAMVHVQTMVAGEKLSHDGRYAACSTHCLIKPTEYIRYTAYIFAVPAAPVVPIIAPMVKHNKRHGYHTANSPQQTEIVTCAAAADTGVCADSDHQFKDGSCRLFCLW